MSNEVIPWSQRSRNGARPLEIRIHNCRSPAGTSQWGRRHAHLVDLEPARARTVACGKGAGAFIHPNHDWTLLMRPLGPDCGDGAAGCDRGAEGCAGAAITAHGGVSDGEDGVVARPLSLDGCWR